MNLYLKNLNRIEFLITYDCTGRCKHCSEGDHTRSGIYLDKDVASKIVRGIVQKYTIQSVMTFGGEALLHPECVCAIHKAAWQEKIPKRQLITNGFFSKDSDKIKAVVQNLKECKVNDILLSVDAFHQETIPIEPVMFFTSELVKNNLPVRLSPAWLVSKNSENEYNIKTTEILEKFKKIGIPESDGNVIFPEGNALKYLKEYFSDCIPDNPYIENPMDLKAISVDPDGSILGSNIYKENILEILKNYNPKKL